MRLVSISQTAPLLVGAIAAVSLLTCALPAANAQGWQNGNNNGGYHQHESWHGNGGGNYQGHSWRHHHAWGESNSYGVQYYSQPQGNYPHYHGSEHRRYYEYQGSQFYINMDTGVRIAL